MSTSLCRQNYSDECEAGVNKQINLELYASYAYLSMYAYFDRDDVALPGFAKYFKKASDEERDHADRLIKFQNQRGGRVFFQDIKKPEVDDWVSAQNAMEKALTLEKTVNQSLLNLHKTAENDAQMQDFIETHYLTEQVEAIKEISDHLTNIKRCGKGLGEYLFDKNLSE